MPRDPRAEGRGLPSIASAEIVDATGLTTAAPGAILTGIADHVYVVRRLTFMYPTDVVAIDMDIKFDTVDEQGTERDFATVHETGDIIEISTVINTWIDPNPPTNTVICYKEFNPPLVLKVGNTVSIVGNDATPANNYDSTAGVSMRVTLDYEDVDAYVYQQNVV